MTGTESTRYKEFRNFLVNELKISKDDIVAWTENAIEAIVFKMIASGSLNVQAALDKAMYKAVRSTLRLDEGWYADLLRNDIVAEAARKIEVKVK